MIVTPTIGDNFRECESRLLVIGDNYWECESRLLVSDRKYLNNYIAMHHPTEDNIANQYICIKNSKY